MASKGGKAPPTNATDKAGERRPSAMDKGDGVNNNGKSASVELLQAATAEDVLGKAATAQPSSSSSPPSEAEMRPLLKVSAPIPIGTEVGRYRIRIWRKARQQAFGIQFASSNGLIEIAEDLPHLGLRQFDAVISVNGMNIRSVEECMGVLRSANVLDMVLQHTELDGTTSVSQQPTPGGCLFGTNACRNSCKKQNSTYSMAVPLRTLLSCSKVQVFGDDRQEFQLVLERKSIKQRFGLNFSADRISRQGSGMSIKIADDQPHLGLEAGDSLVSVNGVAASNVDSQRLLERAMILTLHFRRRGPVEVVEGQDEDPVAVCEEVDLDQKQRCNAVCG